MTLKWNKDIQQNECKIIKKIIIIVYVQVNADKFFPKVSINVL